jgi:hypothetical protein
MASAFASLETLQAGCHYRSDGLATEAESNILNFFGQWIYEAGQFKHVPWQKAPPCRGPNCHGDDDRPPTTTSSPNSTVKRISSMTVTIDWLSATPFDGLTGCIASSNLFPVSGYPHEYEYPP